MPEGEGESMNIQELLELERDYRRVSAEHRAQRVEYWEERFAEVPMMPSHKPREFKPEPILPAPASKEARYKPLEDLAAKAGRPRLSDTERAKRNSESTMRWKRKAGRVRGEHQCAGCDGNGCQVMVAPKCKRCGGCARLEKRRLARESERRRYVPARQRTATLEATQ